MIDAKDKNSGNQRLRAILVLAAVATCSFLYAQPYSINKLYRQDRPAMLFNSVCTTDSGYIILGSLADYNPPYYARLFVGRIDSNGIFNGYKAVYDSVDTLYRTTGNSMIQLEDGEYAFTAGSISTVPKLVFGLYQPNTGSIKIFEYYTPNSYAFHGYDNVEYPGKTFYVTGARTDSSTGKADVVLLKIDSNGNRLWQKYYGTPSTAEFGCSLIKLRNGNMMIGSGKRDLNDQHEHAYTWLLEVDTGGNIVRQWTDPNDSTYSAEGLLQTSDGGFIYGAQKKFWQSVNGVFYTGTVVKMDSAFNKQWTFQGGLENISTGIFDIEELADGSFVGCGNQPFWGNDSTIVSGWIIKLSSGGSIVWDKKYIGINHRGSENFLYDIDVLPDGSLIACGEVQSDTLSDVGWLLKVDSNGCEVENCLTGIAEPGSFQLQLQAYPNPFSSNLTVSVQKQDKVSIYITNAIGQVVYSYNGLNLSNSYYTKNLDLSHLPVGLYLGEVMADGERYVKKVIKE